MFHELKQFARTLTFTPPNWLAGRGVASLGSADLRGLCCVGAMARWLLPALLGSVLGLEPFPTPPEQTAEQISARN